MMLSQQYWLANLLEENEDYVYTREELESILCRKLSQIDKEAIRIIMNCVFSFGGIGIVMKDGKGCMSEDLF